MNSKKSKPFAELQLRRAHIWYPRAIIAADRKDSTAFQNVNEWMHYRYRREAASSLVRRGTGNYAEQCPYCKIFWWAKLMSMSTTRRSRVEYFRQQDAGKAEHNFLTNNEVKIKLQYFNGSTLKIFRSVVLFELHGSRHALRKVKQVRHLCAFSEDLMSESKQG